MPAAIPSTPSIIPGAATFADHPFFHWLIEYIPCIIVFTQHTPMPDHNLAVRHEEFCTTLHLESLAALLNIFDYI
jgi:hypothetical protein